MTNEDISSNVKIFRVIAEGYLLVSARSRSVFLILNFSYSKNSLLSIEVFGRLEENIFFEFCFN